MMLIYNGAAQSLARWVQYANKTCMLRSCRCRWSGCPFCVFSSSRDTASDTLSPQQLYV
jgi:hypothetical protein